MNGTLRVMARGAALTAVIALAVAATVSAGAVSGLPADRRARQFH